MENIFDVLQERSLIKQCSHPDELRELLGKEKITFYIGFDPTADSLHIGHYVQLMTMAHMQRAGHRPIALLGGGTAMIGDPSGKSDMRQMMTNQTIDFNASCFLAQMSRLIDFSGNRALSRNNADWIRSLNFMDFMQDIGVLFSVNHMLAADCYKQRLEKGGLTFFEMGYMLMQSYDFLTLFREHDCVLQVGGDDQWSNILAGADLIRRKERKPAFALTTALLVSSEGAKMGKTEKGAIWLDERKCPVYDFYQYWRNVADNDVETCLKMLTFLPVSQIRGLCSESGEALNHAKEVLAFTLTEQVHGTQKAEEAQQAARALFGGQGSLENMPTLRLDGAQKEETGLRVVDLLVLGGLCASKSDARRMIESGAVSVDDEKITDFASVLTVTQVQAGAIIKKGKKSYLRVTF